jgi:hypothetical protein
LQAAARNKAQQSFFVVFMVFFGLIIGKEKTQKGYKHVDNNGIINRLTIQPFFMRKQLIRRAISDEGQRYG